MRIRLPVCLLSLALGLTACGGVGTTPNGDQSSMRTTASAGADSIASSTSAIEMPTTVEERVPAPTEPSTSTTLAEGSDSAGDEPAESSRTVQTTTTTSLIRVERVPTTTASPAMQGEVPDELLEQVLADAANRAGVEASSLTVVRSEAVTWNDGSLGCPEPGVLYTQEIIDGYWVEIVIGDVDLDYRLNSSGALLLCESNSPRP